MITTAKQEAQAFETLDHFMTRITVVADGSFDEFQSRSEATMPASTTQELPEEWLPHETFHPLAMAQVRLPNGVAEIGRPGDELHSF